MEMVTHTRYSHLVETIDITSTDLEEVPHTQKKALIKELTQGFVISFFMLTFKTQYI